MGVSNETSGLLPLGKTANHELLQHENEKHHRPWPESLKGIIAAFMYMFSHVVSLSNIQKLQRRIPDLELQAFRCAAIVIICVVWMVVKQQAPSVAVQEIPVMVLYGFLVILGSIKEKFNCKKILCVALCLAGVIFVIQPWHGAIQKSVMENKHSKNCISLREKLCSMEWKIEVLLAKCKNYTQFGVNETSNPCESIKADMSTSKRTTGWQFMCTDCVSCWLESANTSTMSSQGKNDKIFELFLLQIPQEHSNVMGIIFVGFGGVSYVLVTSLFKKFPCVGENMVRSLFWSFVIGLTNSLILTFLVESPVWPQNSNDVTAVFVHCSASVCVWFFAIYLWLHCQHNF